MTQTRSVAPRQFSRVAREHGQEHRGWNGSGSVTWNSSFRYAPKPAPYFTGYSDLVKLPDGNIAVLYERGEFEPDDRKADRYGEMGFTVVAFAALNAPYIPER